MVRGFELARRAAGGTLQQQSGFYRGMPGNATVSGTVTMTNLPPIDPTLAAYVRMAEYGASLSVTLCIGGAIVGGDLMGSARYRDAMLATFLNSSPEPLAAGLREAQAEYEREVRAERKPWEHEEMDDAETFYFHLSDARFIGGDGSTPGVGPGFLVRGRLSDVSAFAFGKVA